MTDGLFSIEVDIDPPFEEIDKSLRGQTVLATIRAHEDTLSGITSELTYTATGNPAQPQNSAYRRTFNMLNSYRERVLNRKLPVITSMWESLKEYSSYVIGNRSQQARIHQNRWDNLEIISQKAEILQRDNLNRRIENEVRL